MGGVSDAQVSTPESGTPPPPPRSRGRGRQTVGDMVRSLVLVLVAVFVVLALTVRQHPDREVRRYDYTAALEQARQQAPYDVLVPMGLPDAWTATSARVGRDGDAVTWHLGLVTPDGDYAGLEQSNGRPQTLVSSVAADAEPAGTVTIDGLRWRKLDNGRPERRALVLEGEAVTTVVAGGASWRDLRTLADALDAGSSAG
jgi:hypothetical protein